MLGLSSEDGYEPSIALDPFDGVAPQSEGDVDPLRALLMESMPPVLGRDQEDGSALALIPTASVNATPRLIGAGVNSGGFMVLQEGEVAQGDARLGV